MQRKTSSGPILADGFHPLPPAFFDQDSPALARSLIGKVLRRRWQGLWLSARIIETEAYRLDDKGSHASLGYTHKRRALFMEGGTIYMYYARGADSFNISAKGAGNAVLIKSAYPWLDAQSGPDALALMQKLNPAAGGSARPIERLCAGQTLLCRALALKVPDWDGRSFDPEVLFVDDVGADPALLIQTTRLGIPPGRDEHLPYRFVDPAYASHCTRNPLRRGQVASHHYGWVDRAGQLVAGPAQDTNRSSIHIV
ncbi:DNA-3-methyladenine glycosylase [Herbaspirillum huttiense]|uniref:DNA-3-methyladenine glycosylase n=1 Tax=Herbaspirillum huttiense TaxID=863372 RepID=UPI0006847964|nr:DNA-3-methyladenine glycosylase [Herbaspirillum sp. B39]